MISLTHRNIQGPFYKYTKNRTGGLLSVFLFFSLQALFAQAIQLRGRVINAETNEPLPFVNVVEIDAANGTSTDISGKFSLDTRRSPASVRFSYAGFVPQSLVFTSAEEGLLIKLKRRTYDLRGAVILPGKNPADEIIEKTSANRKNVDPRRAPDGYRYTSYNRMVGTGISDSSDMARIRIKEAETGQVDSSSFRTRRFLDQQYLFLSETVSERKFKPPGKSTETVKAYHTSGLQDPTVALFMTQMQAFTFYDEYFSILGKNYLNPLSKGSTSRYFFNIIDTVFSGVDTVLVIEYRPKQGARFEAMEGVLNINKDKLRLESAIARPLKSEGGMQVSVLQKYAAEGVFMFPVQTTSELSFPGAALGGFKLAFIGNQFVSDIRLAPVFKTGDFAGAEIGLDPLAEKNSERLLGQYRPDSTSAKDRRTYQVVDSIGKKMKLDRLLNGMEALATGKLRIRMFDLDLKRIIRFNNYEGWRFGLGLETNDRLTRWVQLGGYIGYGLKDQGLKYGGRAQVNFERRKRYSVYFEYYYDLLESGSYDVFERTGFLLRSSNRSLATFRYDRVENTGLGFKLRPVPQLTIEPGFRVQNLDNTLGYAWQRSATDPQQSRFRFAETTLTLRYGHKEKFMDNGRRLYSLGTKFPVLYLQLTQGLKNVLGGQFEYSKVIAALDYNVFIKHLGRSSLYVTGGAVFGDVPYAKLFNMRGNYDPGSKLKGLGILSENAFETMWLNEFSGDKFIGVFYRHSFGTLLFKGKYRPEPGISQAIGFSWLQHPERHINFPARDMRHGFFESGIYVDNLLKARLLGVSMGLGAGVFYRYGAYTLPKTIDNFAFRIAYKIGI